MNILFCICAWGGSTIVLSPKLLLLLYIAGNSDYTAVVNADVSFQRGDIINTNHCAIITIHEDTIVEYNEIFNVVLAVNSDRLVIQADRNITQITIQEDDDCKPCIPIHK